ncbi:MAG: response regulator [Candidatus Omnitrophica bacterium]|nr:response regulator [Candidatus Omnitrophota bacterium]
MGKLMVVEDELEACEALASALSSNGYAVRTCTNGAAAIELFRQEKADLVFCDLKLPGLDGLEVLRAIKAMDPWAAVILITGYGSVETATHALRLGAYDFVEKPLTVSLIQGIASRAMDHRRQLRQSAILQGKPGTLADFPARLVELEQVKVDFLKLIVQEMRGPLKTLTDEIGLAAQGFYGSWSELQMQFLKRLHRVHASLSRLMAGSFALFLSHEQRVIAGSQNLNSLMEEILREVSVRCEERHLTLQAALPAAPLTGFTDGEKVVWIAKELLENAVRFTPAGGRIEAVLTPEPDGFNLRVSDTGCGIRPEQRDRLFTTFRSPQGNSSEPRTRICLGLALVRHYVDLLNGSIQLESQPGQGSRFTVILPWSKH